MAFHLGRQGVDGRHSSDGCANTSAKNIQFFHIPRRHLERVNRGIVETRKHVWRNPIQQQLRASRVVEQQIIAGKRQIHFPPTTAFWLDGQITADGPTNVIGRPEGLRNAAETRLDLLDLVQHRKTLDEPRISTPSGSAAIAVWGQFQAFRVHNARVFEVAGEEIALSRSAESPRELRIQLNDTKGILKSTRSFV